MIECFQNFDPALNGLSGLFSQLGYSQPPGSLEEGLKHFFENPKNRIITYSIDDHIVGVVAIAVHHLLVVPKYRGRIEILIVNQNHRKQGIGRMLVEAAESYAVSAGISIMDVSSSLKREKEGAYDFYNKLGFHNTGPEERAYFRKRLLKNEVV